MAKARGASYAPKYYGAWVGGQYYNPGDKLPAGTTEYRVSAIENITGTAHGWRTVNEIFAVGTSYSEIDDAIAELWEDLGDQYGLNN